MSVMSWSELLIAANADGPALSNTTTATAITPVSSKLQMPANWFTVGRKLRVTAHGRISTLVTSPGTLTLDLRLGAVIVANGGAMSLNIVAKTNVPWVLIWDLTCRSIGNGTAATLMHTGLWTSEAVIGSPLPTAGGSGVITLPAATPAVGTGFDSTAAATLDLFGTWSAASASNSILVHQFEVSALN